MAKFAIGRKKKFFLPNSDVEFVEVERMSNEESMDRDDLLGHTTYELPAATGRRRQRATGPSLVHIESRRKDLRKFEYEKCVTDFLFVDEETGQEYKFDPKRPEWNISSVLMQLATETAEFVDQCIEDHNGWALLEVEEGKEETQIETIEKNLGAS